MCRFQTFRTGAVAIVLSCFAAVHAFAADPVSFSVGSFAFERPTDWKWIVPSSAMRKAQLSVPGSDGEAEVTFFHFGAGQGGGVQANVDRWFSQFQNAKSQQRKETLGSTSVTLVDAAGVFLSGMPGTTPVPRPDYALRGAILESPDGDVFVKMTGPATTIAAAEKAFAGLVTAAAKK